MKFIKEIVEELKVFERNKDTLEIKILSIATYIQISSTRRTAYQKIILFPIMLFTSE